MPQMKPVCVNCRLEMNMVKVGAVVQFNAKVAPKVDPRDAQGPYQQFSADVHECKGCGARIVAPASYGAGAIWEAHRGLDSRHHADITIEEARVI
jgi:hypothetical protein